MQSYLTIIFIGIALSMDAFALSISIGSYMLKKTIIFFSFLVGILHFILPLLGSIIGNNLLYNLSINPNYLLGIVLIFLFIQMLIDIKSEKDIFINNKWELSVLALTVSIDSFITGVGLSLISSNIIISSLIFSLLAGCITFLGLLISKISTKYFGMYARFIGIIILLLLIINCFYE